MMDVITPPISTIEEPSTERIGKKFLPRAGAYFIDMLGLMGISYIASYGAGFLLVIGLELFSMITGYHYSFEEVDRTCFMGIVGIVLGIIYYTIFEDKYSGVYPPSSLIN